VVLRFSKDGDDVFDLYDEQPVVAFKIDGDRAFGVEQDLVVLAQRDVGRVFNFSRDGNDPAGDRGDFDIVRQLDAALGLLLVLVLANQNALANRLDNLNRRCVVFLVFTHCPSVPAKRPLLEHPGYCSDRRGRSQLHSSILQPSDLLSDLFDHVGIVYRFLVAFFDRNDVEDSPSIRL